MRKGAGDGEALLLAAGEFGAERIEAVFDFVPERGLAEAFFDVLIEKPPVAHACGARGEGDVFINGKRQADGQRRDHADLAAQSVHVADALHVLAIDLDRAGHARAGGELEGAVDRAEQRGFAGLRGADDAEDFVRLDVEGNAVVDFLFSVPSAEVADFDLGRYHFLRERSQARRMMAVAFTKSTQPSSTVAMA